MSSQLSTYRNKASISGVRLLALLAVGVASASVQAAPVIYTQPENLQNGFSSQSGIPSIAYDDFTLANGGTITDVHWHGFFSVGAEGSQITGFTIQFWNNNPAGGGQPGTSALAPQTFAGNAGQSNPHGCAAGNASTCYDYAVDLTTSFNAAAGTRYWVSIVPTLAFPPQWFWETGNGPNLVSWVDFQGSRIQINNDLAWDLTGTAGGGGVVPEPATLALLGVGLAGLGFSRRRRAN